MYGIASVDVSNCVYKESGGLEVLGERLQFYCGCSKIEIPARCRIMEVPWSIANDVNSRLNA